MNQIIASLSLLLMGTTIIFNGVVLSTDDLIAQTKSTVNHANIHQIATVLELYHLDHGVYPDVSGGEALIEVFEKDGYIRNRPLDPRVFNYEPRAQAQDYTLTLIE